MKTDKLQDALCEIADDIIQDADADPDADSYTGIWRLAWVRWAAVAACLAIAALIAVPALKGKSPTIPEEQPPVTEPVDEPVDEPVNEPTDSPEQPTDNTEWPSRAERAKAAAEQGLLSSGEAGGVAGGEYTYEMYMADYAALTENPVFAALFESEEAKPFDLPEISASTFRDGRRNEFAMLAIDGFTNPFFVEGHVYVEHETGYARAEGFDYAESVGVRTDYLVGDVVVQKFFANESAPYSDSTLDDHDLFYYERVCIGGEWYLVRGQSETYVDTIASTLARITAELGLVTPTDMATYAPIENPNIKHYETIPETGSLIKKD